MGFKKFLLLSLFPFLSISLFAQTYAEPEILWHKTYGGSRMDEVYQIIENMRGGLVAVGETKSKSNGGTDMFFFISDKNGNLISFEKRKGRTKDDGARSVVQTYDGGYVLAGYTDSPAKGYKGKRDGWILKVDDKGITQWDQIYGGGMDDYLTKVLQTPEGDLVIVGTKNEAGWIIKTDRKGQLIWEQTFQYNGKNTFINSAAITDDGSIFLTGYVANDKNKSLLVHAFTAAGKPIDQPLVFDSKDGAIGEDIYWTKEGHLVITGTAGADERRADMCFIEIDTDKTILKKKKFGGRGIDVGTGIIQRSDGSFAMVGDTYSHKPGARRSKLWVKAIDAVGAEHWEKFEGQKREDKGFSIIETSDGSIVVAGYNTSDLISNHDPYIVKYKANNFPKTTDAVSIKTSLKEVVFGEAGDYVKEEERGYLLYKIENTSSTDLFNLRVKVDCQGCKANNLSYFDSLQVGFIPARKTKLFSVPFFSKENLRTGENNFLLTFEESGNRTIPDLNSTIKTERSPQVELAIINPEFSLAAGGDIARRGETIKLKVDLKNKGNKTAEKIYFDFHFPRNVINESEKKYRFATLEPGESKTFEFQFKLQDIYLGSEVSISCRTGEKNPDIGDEQKFSLAVESIGKNQPASFIASVEKEAAEKRKKAQEAQVKLEAEQAKIAEEKRLAEVDRKKKEEALEVKRVVEEKRLKEEQTKIAEAKRIAQEEQEKLAQELEAQRVAEEKRIQEERAKLAEAERIATAERIKKEQELEAKRLAEERKLKEAKAKIAEDQKLAEADRLKKEQELEVKRLADEQKRKEEQAKITEAKQQAEAERIKSEQELEALRIAEEAEIAKKRKQLEEEKRIAKEEMAAREAALKEAQANAERMAQKEQEAQNTQNDKVASLEAQLAAMKAEMAAMKEQEKSMLTIVWISHASEKEVTVKEQIVTVVASAVSSELLTKDNFQILIDGMPLPAGAKYDEVELDAEENDGEFRFVFAKKVSLNMGKNEVSVKVKTDKSEAITPMKIFTYAPKKPNLHILAIGVPHSDLQFTTKDALDFAALFKNQGGSEKALFNEVFIRSITHPDSTSKSNLEEAIEDLKVDWKRGDIVEGDYVVLFISSHGFKDEDNGGFRIKAYPFDGAYASSRSLDFKTNIIDALYSLRCKKLIFIDACNSGAIEREAGSKSSGPDDKEISKALENILNSENSFKMMASCRAQEFSYEDENWQNGAFTKAILEAFSDYKEKGLSADSDNNSILTLNELYNFVSLRVPEIIKSKDPSPETNQTPFMSEQQRVNDLEFYILKN